MNCPSIWIRNQNKVPSKRCLTFLKTRFLFICFKKVCVRTMIVHTEGKRSRNLFLRKDEPFHSLKKYPLKCWFFEVFSLSIPAVLVVGTLPTTLRRCTILGEIVVASVPTIQPTYQGYHCTILHEAAMDEGRFCNSISLVFMNQSWTHLFTISLKANCYKLRRVLLCKVSKQGGCDTNLVSSWSKSQQYCYGMSPTSFDSLLVLANFHLCKLWYF